MRLGRAGGIGEITPICSDARSSISLGRDFDLVIAPQVFVQMFESRADRMHGRTFEIRPVDAYRVSDRGNHNFLDQVALMFIADKR